MMNEFKVNQLALLRRMGVINKRTGFSSTHQGMILIIALIVLVAMTLAGIALVRSVDTLNVIAGNLAFKRGTIQAAEIAINKARTTLPTATDNDAPAQNYSAALLTVSNAQGIPDVLLNKNSFDANGQFAAPIITDPATKEELRYVIERLCIRRGPYDLDYCITATEDNNAGSHDKSMLTITPPPVYRVTVRVDGPRNTVSYTQNTFCQ